MKRYTTYHDKRALVAATIAKDDIVLDVGFWGQGTSIDDPNWPHRYLIDSAKEVYGIDIDFDEARLPGPKERYMKGNAERLSNEMRAIVLREHSLGSLVPRIIGLLERPRSL